MKRALLFIVLLLAILWVHPIAGFILAIVFALVYPYPYIELILGGVLVDVVSGPVVVYGSVRVFIYTILAVLIFWLSRRIQKHINFHV